MKLSTDHIIKDVARETEEAMARLAAAEGDQNAEKTENTQTGLVSPKPLHGKSLPYLIYNVFQPDIPLRKRVVTNYRTESPPLVLPEGVTFPAGLPIDVPFETSKLPLDVAVFNSARGAAENAPASVVSKFLETVLLVGGGSLVRGLAEILQQR